MGGHLSHLEVVQNSEVLNASCGPVRGNVYQHDDGKIVDGYLGIPYAKPPRRLERAEEAEVWTEVKDCYRYGPKPLQTGLGKFAKDPQANTDEFACLNLNVFAPRWKSEQGERPVMVFIHGGGFELGSSADYCHKSISGSLPLKNVVLVTINYRVGVLGFLTTGQDNCKGNFGLWDQTLALQWVQKHIRCFGGNPNNVTVFGQSAGAACTDFLALSPHSRHLFHKLIPMSGSAFCSWAMRTKEHQVKVFEELAEHLGYVKGEQDLLEFYKSKKSVELTEVDGFQKSASGLLTLTVYFDGDFFPNCKPLDELRNEALKKPMMTKEIDMENKDPLKKRVIEFVGDYIFNVGVLESARNAVKHGNDVYLYSFEYCNPGSFGMFQPLVPFPASTHSTDIRYVLGEVIISKFEPSEEDLEMFETMTSLDTNFAKTGNAGWEKLGASDKAENHYKIAHPKGEMKDIFHGGRCEFIQKIVDNAYNEIIYGLKAKFES